MLYWSERQVVIAIIYFLSLIFPKMFLKLQPLLHAIIFLVGLELIFFKAGAAVFIAVALIVISIYNGAKLGGRWHFSILPSCFTLSTLTLLYLITGGIDSQIFILVSTGIYYMALLGAHRLGTYVNDQTAKGMNMAVMAITIFFAYAGAYGIYLNFFVPLYYLMLAYWAVTILVSFQYFSIIKDGSRRKIWIYSFLLAFVMAEMVWVMNFWPFGYLTAGVIALIMYYVLWDLIQSHFLNVLSRKRVAVNMVFFPIVIAFILLSAKWLPIA